MFEAPQTMIDAAQIQETRDSLGPFSLDSPCPLNGSLPHAVENYLEYYGFFQIAKQLDLEYFFGFRHAATSQTHEPYQIATHYWQLAQSKGSVLVLHGLFDHVGLFQRFIGYLLQQGFNVIAIDLPGHGLSSGAPTKIGSFDEYASVVAQTLAFFRESCGEKLGNVYAIGQSTGAAILMNMVFEAQRQGQDCGVERLVFMGPLVRPQKWRVGRWIYKCFGGLLKRVRRDMSRPNSHDREFHHFLANHDPLQAKFVSVEWVHAMVEWIEGFDQQPTSDIPLLIIQGSEDQVVDWSYNVEAVKAHFSQAQLSMIEGARHHLPNEAMPWRQAIYTCINQFLRQK